MSPENPVIVENYRKKLGGMFSAEDLKAERIVNEILMPINWRLQSIYGEGKSVPSLADLKDFLAREGREVKPVELTAMFLKASIHDHVLIPSVNNSMSSKDDAMQFIVWHDFAIGFNNSLATLLMANEDKAGKLELPQGAIEDLSQDQAELSTRNIIELSVFWAQFETEATRLLSGDETGAKVLAAFRERLEEEKGNPRIFGYFIPEFVIAGVELAKDMQRVVYPQAASLYN